MLFPAARLWLLMLLPLATACAASPAHSARPDAGDPLAQRVLDILEHRHLTHRRLDADTRARVLAARPEADAAQLDALAKRYDPHSAYVSQAELRALRAEIAGDVPQDHLAHGRIVEHDGARIGWVVLPSFYLLHDGRSTTDDVRFIAGQLATRGAQLLLLDLRGNGGGVIAEAVRLAGALSGPGPIAYVRTADGASETLRASDVEPIWRGPLVVWLDAGTASVSELFAAALQDRGRALLIGERTYGKGSGQTLVLLSSPLGATSGAVRVSDRLFYRLDGKALQRSGVQPDIEIAHTGAVRATERDNPGALHAEDLAAPEPAAVTRIDPAQIERLRADRSTHGQNDAPPRSAAGAVPLNDDVAVAIARAYLRAYGSRP